MAILLRLYHLLRRGMRSRILLGHALFVPLHLMQKLTLCVSCHLLVSSRPIILTINHRRLIKVVLWRHMWLWALLNELLLICLGLVVHVNRRCSMRHGDGSLLRILRHLSMRASQSAIIDSILSYLGQTLIISHHCSVSSSIDRVATLDTILSIVDCNTFELSVICVCHHYVLWVGRLWSKFLTCQSSWLCLSLNNARSCIAHVTVNSWCSHLRLLMWFQKWAICTIITCDSNVLLIEIIWQKSGGFDYHVGLLRASLTNCTISSRPLESTFVWCVIHLLFSRATLKQCSSSTWSLTQVWLIPAVSNLLDTLCLTMLLHHLLIWTTCCSYQLIHCGHSLLAFGWAGGVKNSWIWCLLIFHGTMWLAYLNLLNGLGTRLDDSALPYLVIIIVILHLLILV